MYTFTIERHIGKLELSHNKHAPVDGQHRNERPIESGYDSENAESEVPASALSIMYDFFKLTTSTGR